MWIIVRLVSLAIGFGIRLRQHLSPPKPRSEWDAESVYADVVRSKSGEVRWFRVGMDFPMPVVFTLHVESRWDRAFKALGFAEEFQTGDAAFDQRIYIAADHPALHEVLAEDAPLRTLILAAMASGYESLSTDGKHLWLRHFGDVEPSNADILRLEALRLALKPIGRRIKLRRDPFFLRVIVVESSTAAIFAYAFATVMEWGFTPTLAHIDGASLWTFGLLVAMALFTILLIIIRALLGGSARGQRIVAESSLLLLLGLPFTGVSLVGEVNRRLDSSPPVVVTREITDRYALVKRGYRTRSRRYYVEFADSDPVHATPLPTRMEVSRELWARLPRRGPITQHLGTGRLGLVWHRGFVGY